MKKKKSWYLMIIWNQKALILFQGKKSVDWGSNSWLGQIFLSGKDRVFTWTYTNMLSKIIQPFLDPARSQLFWREHFCTEKFIKKLKNQTNICPLRSFFHSISDLLPELTQICYRKNSLTLSWSGALSTFLAWTLL